MTSGRLLQRPIYLQVCDVLSERIASGEWKAGQAIPNEIELARDMGVSGGTVRKALELMEGNQMLIRRQGRGTFVADPAVGGFVDRFCNLRNPEGETVGGSIEVVEIAQGVANDAENARLQLGKQAWSGVCGVCGATGGGCSCTSAWFCPSASSRRCGPMPRIVSFLWPIAVA